jgi:hypothetical protein
MELNRSASFSLYRRGASSHPATAPTKLLQGNNSNYMFAQQNSPKVLTEPNRQMLFERDK